ncbi:GNAT family N-acetyltransferase [Weeksellaceae bacterium KMM 9713]|uniref:GNAT family N-acetyltransferase n=1 Tax=Profundicola chukchiensis TaxID=2961959 RepID=A0A9X4MVU4_9FLAO|nr:GNAT family N-acetyltransferase [Profundicola chukchiensis]MDG4945003.1 GNAT family N-acetyltransferase [Profundicola chukchiensis]
MMKKFKLHSIVDESQLNSIKALAEEIWPSTYSPILSNGQISYMMDLMYSERALQQQLENGVLFYLVLFNDKEVGYTAVEPNYKDGDQLYIHKLYILPQLQGIGLGKSVIESIAEIAKKKKLSCISLNVNRYNKALYFYEKLGFKIEKEEDIDIGNNYYMNDYVMQKKV